MSVKQTVHDGMSEECNHIVTLIPKQILRWKTLDEESFPVLRSFENMTNMFICASAGIEYDKYARYRKHPYQWKWHADAKCLPKYYSVKWTVPHLITTTNSEEKASGTSLNTSICSCWTQPVTNITDNILNLHSFCSELNWSTDSYP